MDAFWDLDSERMYAEGPIPENKIIEYAYRMQLSECMHGVLRIIIRSLDRAKHTWQEENRPKPDGSNGIGQSRREQRR